MFRLFVLLLFGGCVECWKVVRKTRTVSLSQGDLIGMTIQPDNPDLRAVEVFLGIPYAAPPVGKLRYMPPGSPPPWRKTKYANSFGPVCNQVLPKIENDQKKMSVGRADYLKRLLPYLRNQSEDCLHLNIYAPAQEFLHWGLTKLPVLVFIHGESFSWNSGNPYDGSVLSSYGEVIFVTINFRLGIFGFLKQSLEPQKISNLGLLDQIAALRWIKDNIANFGGDPNSVTVVGHHTGAVAVNYLMLSPVVLADNGLFQRVILMSGSALANWAEMRNPDEALRIVAEHLGCPHAELQHCLRKASVENLLSVQIPDDLGPSIDGIVVSDHPRNLMTRHADLFTRYDMLCGFVESECYHFLDGVTLSHGMLEDERDSFLKHFFSSNFPNNPELAQAKATAEYSELERGKPAHLAARGIALGILSDARIVAPLIQAAVYHSSSIADAQTYMYLFSYRTKNGEYPSAESSVYGDELPYLLGIPLEGPSFQYMTRYTEHEKLLSELIMTTWTNFVKTGNPNSPKKYNYLSMSLREWKAFENLSWPRFEPHRQAYYQFQFPPSVGFHYRHRLINFWNNYLPSFLHNNEQPDKFFRPRPKQQKPFWLHEERPSSSFNDPQPPRRGPPIGPLWETKPQRPESSKPPSYGSVKFFEPDPDENERKFNPYPPIPPSMDDPEPTEPSLTDENVAVASSFTFSIVIVVGIIFIFINIGLFFFIWRQRRNLRLPFDFSAFHLRPKRTTPSTSNSQAAKNNDKFEIKSILKSNEQLYDVVKKPAEKWSGIYRPDSSSSVSLDAHTKVAEWMSQGSTSRTKTDVSSDTDKVSYATTKSSSGRRAKKISVAIDATPSSRSESVLKQIPVELTKSLDSGMRRLGAKPRLQRSVALSSDDSFIPNHSHTESDPVKTTRERVLKTFEPLPKDINVTSRDELSEHLMLTPEEALDNIKRRNFPKVLPDFPEHDDPVMKRMSYPQHSEPHIKANPKKVPPPPPPRVTTLARKTVNRNTVPNFLTTYKDLDLSAKKSDKIERRNEPRVIIKPTLTDPNLKKSNSKIPRVTRESHGNGKWNRSDDSAKCQASSSKKNRSTETEDDSTTSSSKSGMSSVKRNE